MQSSSSGAAAPKGFPRGEAVMGWPYIFARRERRPRRSAERTETTTAPRRIRTTFPFPLSLRGRRPWQSPGKIPETVRCTRRLPRRFAPRNDVVILTWSFYWWCGSGHPRRGGPTVSPVGNAVPGVPRYAPNQPPHPGESARSSHLSFRGAQPRGNLLEKSRKTYEVPGDCHVASLLAMTWWFLPGPSIFGAEAVLRENIHRLLKLCGQIPRKSSLKSITAANFSAKTQKTPQTFQSLWRDFYFSALVHPFAGAVLHFGQHGGQTAALLLG